MPQKKKTNKKTLFQKLRNLRKLKKAFFRYSIFFSAAIITIATSFLFIFLALPLHTKVVCHPDFSEINIHQSQKKVAQIKSHCPPEFRFKSEIPANVLMVFSEISDMSPADNDLEINSIQLTPQLKSIYLKHFDLFPESISHQLIKYFPTSLDLKISLLNSRDQKLIFILNNAYFGRQIYGLEQASNYYLNKSFDTLTLLETIDLAAIITDPSLNDPVINPDQHFETRSNIIRLLERHGRISSADRNILLKTPVSNFQLNTQDGFVSALIPQIEALEDPDPQNPTPLDLHLEIDPQLQEDFTQLVTQNTPESQNYALMAIENSTKEIQAFSGNKPSLLFKNYYPQYLMLPFVYVAGFEAGLVPGSITHNTEIDVLEAAGLSYIAHDQATITDQFVTIRQAFEEKYPIPAIKILQMVNHKRFEEFVKSIGLPEVYINHTKFKIEDLSQKGTTTMFELAGAYATLARNGSRVRIRWANSDHAAVEDTLNRRTISPLFSKNYGQVISPESAYLGIDLLKNSPENHKFNQTLGLNEELIFMSSQLNDTTNGNVLVTPSHTLVFIAETEPDRQFASNQKIKSAAPTAPTQTALKTFRPIARRFQKHTLQSPLTFKKPEFLEEQELCAIINGQATCIQDLAPRGTIHIGELQSKLTTHQVTKPQKDTKLIHEDIYFQDFTLNPAIPANQQQLRFYSHENVTWFVDGEIIGRGKEISWTPVLGAHTLTARIGYEYDTFEFTITE